MSDKLEYKIVLIDQYGRTLAEFEKNIGASTKKVNGLNDALNRTSRKRSPYDTHNRSITQLRANLERYKKAHDRSLRTDHMEKYKRLIAETEKKIKDLGGAWDYVGEKSEAPLKKAKGGFGLGKLAGLVGIGTAMLVAKKATDEAFKNIKASSEVEKYSVTLKTMLGTTDKARERMQEYFDIAKKTPFDLPQVVEAGNKLQALGRYSRENVVMLGDLAAAAGKPMEQAMSAFSKLASGQKGIAVDMFRDLLITTDDWTKATGKGVSKSGELLATTEELIAALPQIMKSKGFFGMMANQAETTEGKVANLEDGIFQLRNAMGERLQPAYNKVLDTTNQAIDKLTKIVEIPVEQKIIAEKVELNALVEALINANEKGAKRNDIIDELQRKYPDFIKNIDLEKASTEELRKELTKTNLEYDKKIRKAAYARRMEQLEEEIKELGTEMLDHELAIHYRRQYEDKKSEYLDFLRQKGIEDKDNIGFAIKEDGRVISEKANAFVGSYSVEMPVRLNAADVIKAKTLQAEMNDALSKTNPKAEQKLEKKTKEQEKVIQKRNAIEQMYNQELLDSFKDTHQEAVNLNLSDQSVYNKLFGTGKNAAELAKEFKTLRSTPLEQLDETKMQRIQQFLDGSATGTMPASVTPTTSSSTVSGKAASISAGGTRSTAVTINLGNMIESVIFQGGLTENKQELESQLTQIMSRVLGMAAVS